MGPTGNAKSAEVGAEDAEGTVSAGGGIEAVGLNDAETTDDDGFLLM